MKLIIATTISARMEEHVLTATKMLDVSVSLVIKDFNVKIRTIVHQIHVKIMGFATKMLTRTHANVLEVTEDYIA